jgi:hypothetical protein
MCPDCTVALSPASTEVLVGDTELFLASVDPPPIIPGVADDGTVQRVTFSSTGAMSCPSPDTSSPYTSACLANSSGTDTITARVYMRDVAGNLVGIPICLDTSDVTSCLASCTIAFDPASIGVSPGRTMPVEAVVNISAPGCSPSTLPNVSNVEFNRSAGGDGVDNTSITDDPTTITSSFPYITQLTGITTGSDNLSATATLDNDLGTTCTISTSIEAYNAGWWQAQDADITADGDIGSILPGGFLIDGNEPGVAMFTGTLDTSSGVLSTRNWRVDEVGQPPMSEIPSDFWTASSQLSSNILSEATLANPTTGYSYKDYRWFYYDGSSLGPQLTIEDSSGDGVVSLGDEKVVLVVDGASLKIDAGIDFDTDPSTADAGMFIPIVENSIIFDTLVGGVAGSGPHTKGIYVAGGLFETQTQWPTQDSQLHVLGSVIAGGYSLNRDMFAVNSTDPAELFEFSPGMMFMVPPNLSIIDTRWKEVAP